MVVSTLPRMAGLGNTLFFFELFSSWRRIPREVLHLLPCLPLHGHHLKLAHEAE